MYIDTDLPNNKQKQILENSKASVILSDNEDEILEWQTTAHITLLGLYKLKIFQKSQQTKPVSLSLPLEWSIAYLVYTSGSTGAPKIVRVPHSCIIPNILDLRYLLTSYMMMLLSPSDEINSSLEIVST